MKWVMWMLAALPLFAEADFTGSWMLNLSKSQYGQFPAPEVMLRSVTYANGTLTMSTYQKGAQGEVTTELKYSTDGTTSVNKDSRGTARWQGDTLIIESSREAQGESSREAQGKTSREAQGARLTQRDQWTLSADGKTLTIAIHVSLPNGAFDVKQVFEKAPAVGGTRANF